MGEARSVYMYIYIIRAVIVQFLGREMSAFFIHEYSVITE